MLFIPNDDALEAKCKEIFEKVAQAENFKVGSWSLLLWQHGKRRRELAGTVRLMQGATAEAAAVSSMEGSRRTHASSARWRLPSFGSARCVKPA